MISNQIADERPPMANAQLVQKSVFGDLPDPDHVHDAQLLAGGKLAYSDDAELLFLEKHRAYRRCPDAGLHRLWPTKPREETQIN